MGRFQKLALPVVAMVLIFTPLAGLAAESPRTITGLVLADSEGRFLLETSYGEFLLEGDLPDDLPGQRIRVTGMIEETDEGARFLIVIDYEPLDH